VTAPQNQIIEGYETTLDYLSGDWQIYQLKDGHRYSTDDVVTAAYAIENVPAPPTKILDLGTGIGSVAMMLAWRWPNSKVVGIEAQAISVELGRQTRAHNGADDRVQFIHGDFRSANIIPDPGTYPLVTGSPPYLPPDEGTISNHMQKAYCRFELRGGVEDYCMAASRAMTPDGYFSMVFGARWVPRVFEAASAAGLSIRRWRRLVPRVDREPLLAVFLMRHISESTKPEQQPDLVIRGADDKRTPEMVKLRGSLGMPDVPRSRV